MGHSSYPGSKEWMEHNYRGISLLGHKDVKVWGHASMHPYPMKKAREKMHASMHVHESKGHKALGHVTWGLGHPPKSKSQQEGPPSQKRGSLSLSSLMNLQPISLYLLEHPLSLLQMDKAPLFLACVQRAKLGFLRWHALSL